MKFRRVKRVATRVCRYGGSQHSIQSEHMSSEHRRCAEWTPERFQRQARNVNPESEGLILAVWARRLDPKQGFRTCLGVLRLFGGVDTACAEAVNLRIIKVQQIFCAPVASIVNHRPHSHVRLFKLQVKKS